jgi:N-acetylmuramoyl-L-alanine amidase
MPDDGETAAEPAAGGEPADASWAEQPAPPKLGRVPHVSQPAVEIVAPRRPAHAPGRPGDRLGQKKEGAAPRVRRHRWLPWLGLVLFAGSLYGLLSGLEWPLTTPVAPPALVQGGVIVVIDPGHGGMDSGAVAQGVVEKDLNLDVGLRVARLLADAGLNVKLTRQDDHYVPLETRVEIANALPGAVFVSIHFNDAQGEGRAAVGRASGIETYYSGAKEGTPAASGLSWVSLFHGGKSANPPTPSEAVQAGAVLADSIQRSLIENTAAPDRGIKEAGLYVTRRVLGPAVLVEGGFVSHPQEAHLLQDPVYRQTIAKSIAEGILHYLQKAQPSAGGSPLPRA